MPQVGTRRSITTLDLAGNIVSAYVANNSLAISELPNFIGSVHVALSGLAEGGVAGPPIKATDKVTPAQIRKSITPGALISFIDGKAYKTLKRHLASHGLNPRDYRECYGLPADYPMVAANYAEQRSAIARAIGLGQPREALSVLSATNGRRKGR